jgi:dATP pyrophosphohydrolase
MSTDRDSDGYRREPGNGPRIRSDIVDVYVARISEPERVSRSHDGDSPDTRIPALVQLLQMKRTRDPLAQTWQPVMGHIEAGETAIDAALREVREEVGLEVRSADCLGVWALEQVYPFYIASIDCIVLSPRFVAVVTSTWQPKLNAEHSEYRWVAEHDARAMFMWPGQAAAIADLGPIVRGTSPAGAHSRVV